MWSEIGEGLLEASSSAVLTLLMALEGQISSDIWTLASILSSVISMSRAAIRLDFYGQPVADYMGQLRHALFVVAPRATSRVTTLAFAAYLSTFAASKVKSQLPCW